ncbi:hypothetical protein ACIQCR_17070 [Streptomyces sp. NPDC093249]|uniref:hypothetical protein n=1 Tax=unclassified Streptomyces TaxID=2593676 RepID=UPI00344B7160
MIRYGLAIKALSKNGTSPEDEEDDTTEPEPSEGVTQAVRDDRALQPASASPVPEGDSGPSVEQLPDESEPGPNEPGSSAPDGGAPSAPDDARPWSGDPYDEGEETDPSAAFAAYKGERGEEAWLDQAPDGTLTGWVRDETGQVWRYTDPAVWAIDVDDAPMTRTHSQAADEPPTDDHDGQDSLFTAKR